MPELAEIKIMSDYINDVCEGEDFTSFGVSEEVSKRLGLIHPTDLQVFTISAKSRGKELMLALKSGSNEHRLSISMGMSGNWVFTKRDNTPKHTHLKFNTISGNSLCLVDTRRFARWKWASGWSQNRGPCPLTQFGEFKEHITQNIDSTTFRKPIHIILMDQRYFNGIGNYLRAEILYRADQDPFEEACTALIKNPNILELCRQIPHEAYVLGGGQLKDWENPFDVPAEGSSSWIQCYGKSNSSIIDKNGRKLWYNHSQLKNERTI